MDKVKVQMLADKLSEEYSSETASALYSEVIRSLYTTALSVVKDSHLAHDAAQDAFVKVLCELRSGRRLVDVVPYFQKAAQNCAIIYWRLRQRELFSDDYLQPMVTDLRAEVADYVERLILSEDFLKLLNEDERFIVVMFDCEGYTHREIAAWLLCPESTVRNKYARAIKKMRRWAKEQGLID